MDDRWVRMLMKLGLSRSVAEDRMSIFLTKLKQKVLMKGGAEEELRKGVDGVADAVIDAVQQSEKITPFLKVLPNFMFVLHNIEKTPAFGSLVGAWMDFFTDSLGASTDAIQAIIVNIPGFGQAINFVIGIFVWPFLAMVSLSRKEFSESTESFLKVIPLGIGKAMSMMFAKGDKFFVKMDSRWDKIREQFSTLIENSRQSMNTPKVQSKLESNIGDAYEAESPAPPPAPAPARTVPAPPPVQTNVSRTTQEPVTGGLRDTTLRSAIMGSGNVNVKKGPDGSMISTTPYDHFDQYEQMLRLMGQLCRLTTADTGIIHEAIMKSGWLQRLSDKNDCATLNNTLTNLDRRYLGKKMKEGPHNHANVSTQGKAGTPSAGINQGIRAKRRGQETLRPMESYCLVPSVQPGMSPCRYVSSPNDVTFMATRGDLLSTKTTFGLTPQDLIISFKPSSTIENFKDDVRTLTSVISSTEFGQYTPPGFPRIPETSGKVPAGFMDPLMKSWSFISQMLSDYKPTRVFVTGHSLGAAFATLLGFMLAELRTHPSLQKIASVHIITFGSPTTLNDVARNRFNSFLDSGFLTLDRVVTQGSGFEKGGIGTHKFDPIPLLPAAMTHPGFQPLKTEIRPEKRTGRAYNISAVKTVYGVKGGFVSPLSSSENKEANTKYSAETATHMPTKLVVPAETTLGGLVPHAECMGMLGFGGFRTFGMKNPGFSDDQKNFYTFVGDIFEDGVRFQYMFSEQQPEKVDPIGNNTSPQKLLEDVYRSISRGIGFGDMFGSPTRKQGGNQKRLSTRKQHKNKTWRKTRRHRSVRR